MPDPDLDFLSIPDLGVKKALDPGSGSATLLKSTNIPQRSGLVVVGYIVHKFENKARSMFQKNEGDLHLSVPDLLVVGGERLLADLLLSP
jgi:hypothetical protein